ncbi:MAG: tripartite tricarboxylate transporter substrate binding protein [Burkholderiales bacterium]
MRTTPLAFARSRGRLCAALALLALAVAPGAIAQSAIAEAYPNRLIRIIVPTGAGGITDILARYVGQKLSESVGQPVVIDNRAGAGGTIGTAAVTNAAPDGYTLLWVFPSHPVNPSLYPKLPYDTVKDLAPITRVSSVELVLVVNAAVRARSVAELIALEKGNPGTMNYGAVGSSLGHLAAVVFNRMAGTRLVHVPYRGAPQVEAALLANDVQLFFDAPITAAAQVKAGRTRALAVTSARRLATMPDVPTMIEAGVAGYEVTGWNGILAPAGTPREIIRRLNEEVVRILRRAEVREWLAARGVESVGSTPEEFGAVIEADIAKWARVVADAGLKAGN